MKTKSSYYHDGEFYEDDYDSLVESTLEQILPEYDEDREQNYIDGFGSEQEFLMHYFEEAEDLILTNILNNYQGVN